MPNVGLESQTTISRSDLQWRWPFTVGTGTLACDAGAVVFRSNQVTYALNDAARTRGFASADAVRVRETSGPPHNPLGRIRQELRTEIFEVASRCADAQTRSSGNASSCRDAVRQKYSLTDPELQQVEAEGRERFWKPLTPPFRSVAPVVERGLKLCQ